MTKIRVTVENDDIRWLQRFQNFLKAFESLDEAVMYSYDISLNEMEVHGLIQRFEFTHELAWNVLKDYFEYQGNTAITGSRDTTREAFNKGLIEKGEGWLAHVERVGKVFYKKLDWQSLNEPPGIYPDSL